MKAIQFDSFGGPLELRDLPDPEGRPDAVVIRVKASGLCRSDWHGWMGHDADVRLPHVPGHEFAGIVEDVGRDVRRWKCGDRVTVPFCCGCGVCPQCAAGFQNICDNYFQPGFTHWGSFASHVAVHYADTNLVSLPRSIDFTAAASLGCRFITSFRAVVDQGGVEPGQWVAVFGCGGVGLSAIQIASAYGAHVVGIDIDDEKLAVARSLGARETIHAKRDGHAADAVAKRTGGGAHIAIDALGSSETCLQSVRCLRKRGRHIQVGVMAGPDSETPIPMGMVMGRELELLGSHGMQAHRFDAVFEMMTSGKIDPGKLVARTISLREVPEAIERMAGFEGAGITVIDDFQA